MSGSVDREIDCGNCGNEISLIGDINQVEQWVEGQCLKCGWVVHTTTDFFNSTNEWRKCQEDDLKQIDNSYLYTNRYKKVPTKEKMLELGWFKEEEIEKWIDFHNSSQCSKSLPWDFSIHKGYLNREYGKLRRIQEYEELKEVGESVDDQSGLEVLKKSYKDVLEEVS